MFFKILQKFLKNSQEKTCARQNLFLNEVACLRGATLLKRDSGNYFEKHLRTTASAYGGCSENKCL